MSSRLVVLQSFPKPKPPTNPFNILLVDSIADQPDIEVRTFSRKFALFGRYDVFHVHWPEIFGEGRTAARRALRQAFYLLFLGRIWLTNTPVVRTVHNLDLPQGISRSQRILLRLTDRLTTLRIALNTSTPTRPDQAWETILHGDYVGWFADFPKSTSIPGRLAFVGRIRRYKGVDVLLGAFRQTALSRPDLTLHIAGYPSTPELGEMVREAAQRDPRIHVQFGFITDEEVVREIGEAELVVLPYREMHNSGAALTALSLDRPVLVPDNVVNRRLADEVGSGWVHHYADDVTGGDLIRALDSLKRDRASGTPDLSARAWSISGERHAAAYRRAVAVARQGRPCRGKRGESSGGAGGGGRSERPSH